MVLCMQSISKVNEIYNKGRELLKGCNCFFLSSNFHLHSNIQTHTRTFTYKYNIITGGNRLGRLYNILYVHVCVCVYSVLQVTRMYNSYGWFNTIWIEIIIV